MDGDEHEDVVRSGLRILDEYVEVAVVVENSSVEQFKFRLVLAATPVLLHELRIWKLPLRILVEHL
jgi:hypothetical protein